MRKFLRSPKILILILILVLAGGAFIYLRGQSSERSLAKAEHPEYMNFGGNYVFSVPKTYSIDEQAVPGIVIVHSGTQANNTTLGDIYEANGISLQQISDLPDKSTKGFKEYINKTFIEELKKTLSTQDVKVKFGKIDGQDFAEVNAKKDGKQNRFVYLKNGQHPVAVVAKTQTDQLKKIASTLVDAPASDIKDEVDKLKQTLQNIYQLIKDQKVAELYNGATPEFRSNSKQAEVAKAVQDVNYFAKDTIVVSGITYSPTELVAGLRYT